MGRPRRNVVRGNRKVKTDVGNENITVDTNVESFYRDEVDKFHDEKEKLLLDVEDDEANSDEQSGSDKEVLELHLSDSEQELSEEEEQVATEAFYVSSEEDDQEPEVSDKAWGRSKKAFYNTDDVEEVEEGEEEEAEELEEKEAMMLQKRLATGLDQEDFDAVDIALEEDRDKAEQELQGQKETVIKDLSKLSSAEKMAIIEKDSPELVGLLGEFSDKLSLIMGTLHPILAGAKQSPDLLTEPGRKYLEMKLHLCQCYCLNILFYLVLKSNRISVLNHPVIEVIVKIRQLMDKLHPVDESLSEQLEEALLCVEKEPTSVPLQLTRGQEVRRSKRKLVKDGEEEEEEGENTAAPSLKKQKAGNKDAVMGKAGNKEVRQKAGSKVVEKEVREKAGRKVVKEEDSEDPLDYYNKIRTMKEAKKTAARERHAGGGGDEEESDDGEDADGKRAINYQIAKNKGLVPKRKKEQRNPRVKHRKKFEKAKIRHKSQVHPVVTEMQRYGGEKTGIRAGLSRSVRIK